MTEKTEQSGKRKGAANAVPLPRVLSGDGKEGGEVMVDKQRRRDHQEAARNGSDAGSISPECSCKQASEY
jgi:hypothetical protein